MGIKTWLDRFSIENKGLYFKLLLIFGLFFITPVMGFLYFAVKYDILNDDYIPIFFIAILVIFLFGFMMLRKIFDQIGVISRDISKTIANQFSGGQMPVVTDELQGIFRSFRTLEGELRKNFGYLEKKTAEIATLKELSELCYMTFNPDDLLYITLERALKLTGADIGSILILNPQRDAFLVQATIGLGDRIKKGDHVDYATSIAKYAVINKSPLLVVDIEKDTRFGRASRAHYATGSFICMPLKSIQDIIGVLTISRKWEDVPFEQGDIDILTPLVSSAAFTYDNLRLINEAKERGAAMQSMGLISKAINSRLRDTELFHAILEEVRRHVPCDIAILLDWDKTNARNLSILYFLAFVPTQLTLGNTYEYEGSIIDRVIKQQSTVFLDDTSTLTHPLEKELCVPESGNGTCLLMTLKVEGRITGVLILQNVVRTIVDRQAEPLAMMVDSLSLAIEKERMISSFINRNHQLDTIRQIGSALSASTFDIEKVLKYTMDMIRIAMNVEAGSLLLLEGNELRFEVAFNIDVAVLKPFPLKLGQGIAGYSAARGETIMVPDVSLYPHFHPQVDQQTGFQTRSALCVPMVSQGKVIGVIEVLNKINGTFDDNDVHLLQSITTSVSIAMENARLYKEMLSMAETERGIRNMFQKFVPKEIVDKILLGHKTERPIINEFRALTLLNIDIRGFSPLSKRIGPQKTVAMLNLFFATMGGIVFKNHGIVDKYLGDGFLALFGAPVPSAVDADNAVMSALEMQKAMSQLNEDFQRQFGTALTMGISIHTGEVVVGNIGFEKKMDYTVIGDAVNFVFKLQSLCKSWPDNILISEKTCHAAQSPLAVEEIGAFEIEPEAGKLKIYRLLGLKK